MKRRELQAVVQAEKDRLDTFLRETMVIERKQMQTDDGPTLRAYLDQITEIKLRALEELANEDLRGDTVFAIFLQQCANVIRKIQAKLAVLVQGKTYPVAAATEK